MERAKKSIRNLSVYKTSDLPVSIKLDANEGENILLEDIIKNGIKFDENFNLSRYPDNDARLLKLEISKYIKCKPENIIVGNGSSEMIELIIKTFVDRDEIILSPVPTFTMYLVFSEIYSTKFVGVSCNEDFSVDINNIIEKATELKPKVIFLCNPNNPTGFLIGKKDIEKLILNTDSIVVIDEAYIDFAEGSMVDEISKYENLIVLRTLSKALGLAGIRLGYMIANEKIIDIINRVRSPYNLNSITQYLGVLSFKNKDKIFDYVEKIKIERKLLYNNLKNMGIKVYNSKGNFIFFYSNIKNLYEKLIKKGILIRKFKGELENYYRVTVGNELENKIFIESFREVKKNENS